MYLIKMRKQNMKAEKSGSFRETKTTGHFVLPLTEQNLMEDRLQTTDILSNQFSQSVSRGRSEGLFLLHKCVPNSHCGRFLNPYVDH